MKYYHIANRVCIHGKGGEGEEKKIPYILLPSLLYYMVHAHTQTKRVSDFSHFLARVNGRGGIWK